MTPAPATPHRPRGGIRVILGACPSGEDMAFEGAITTLPAQSGIVRGVRDVRLPAVSVHDRGDPAALAVRRSPSRAGIRGGVPSIGW
jgi:hypothetical protein